MILEEAMEEDSVPSNEGDAIEEDHDDEDITEETNGWFSYLDSYSSITIY